MPSTLPRTAFVASVVLQLSHIAVEYKDALIAIASVAAVFWTGGLIVRQLYAKVVSNDIVSGMEFCTFSALASIFGLIFTGRSTRLGGWSVLLVLPA